MTPEERRALVEAPLPVVRIIGSHYAGAPCISMATTSRGIARNRPMHYNGSDPNAPWRMDVDGYSWAEILKHASE